MCACTSKVTTQAVSHPTMQSQVNLSNLQSPFAMLHVNKKVITSALSGRLFPTSRAHGPLGTASTRHEGLPETSELQTNQPDPKLRGAACAGVTTTLGVSAFVSCTSSGCLVTRLYGTSLRRRATIETLK